MNKDTEIKGKTVDDQTRCIHYHTQLDIIAIKFKCCNVYYPCYYCHQEVANHKNTHWGKEEFDTKAVMCGICKTEMSINEYLMSNNTCPICLARFNPRCSNHYHFYFNI